MLRWGLAAEGRAYGGGRLQALGARILAALGPLARPRLEAAPQSPSAWAETRTRRFGRCS